MKFSLATVLGSLIGGALFLLYGPLVFREFHIPTLYALALDVMGKPMMVLGKQFQIFIISTLLAIFVIVFEKLKRKKQEDISIPPALNHKISSIIDPTPTPKFSYVYQPRKASTTKHWLILLPLGLITFFLSATLSTRVLSEETQANNTIPTPPTVLSFNTQNLKQNTINNSTNKMVISEVYYKPDNSHRINNSTNESEWLEIHNQSNEDINLANWSIKDFSECDNLSGQFVIPAGRFAIVTSAIKEDFLAKWPLPSETVFISIPGRLGNGLDDEDELTLRATTCTATNINIISKVIWGNANFSTITQLETPTPGR